jgi:hypothetical protein
VKKGIILEQHRKYTVILTKDGEFRKMNPIRDAEIGMEVTLDAAPKRKWGKQRFIPVSILAAACMFFLLFQMVPAKSETYAYVVVDINPSLELEVTEDMTVHSVRPINEDAQKIIKELDSLEEMEIHAAMDRILDTSETYDMINEQKNMLVGVSYSDEQKIDDRLPDPIEEYVEAKKNEWNIASFHVPSDVREEAIHSNTSMNEKLAEKIEKESNVEEQLSEQEKDLIYAFYKNKEEDETPKEEEQEIEEEKQEEPADESDTLQPDNNEEEEEPISEEIQDKEVDEVNEEETEKEKDIKREQETIESNEEVNDLQDEKEAEEELPELQEEELEKNEERPLHEQNETDEEAPPIKEEKEGESE